MKTPTELHVEVLKTLKLGSVTAGQNPGPKWLADATAVHAMIDGAMEAAIAALQRTDHTALLSDVAHQLQTWANRDMSWDDGPLKGLKSVMHAPPNREDLRDLSNRIFAELARGKQ